MVDKVFWSKRLKNYHKKMLKYMRYVLNDHLMMVWLFLLGFCAVQYAALLKQLTTLPNRYVWLMGLLLAGLPMIGKLVTLVEEADGYFLNMLYKDWKKYFLFCLGYSLWLPIIVIGVSVLMVSPILLKSPLISGEQIACLIVMEYILKVIDLEKQLFLLESMKIKHIIVNVTQISINYLVILAMLIASVRLAVVLIVLTIVTGVYLISLWYRNNQLFNWQMITENEQRRQDNWYRFIELFVDTNHLKKGKIAHSVLTQSFQKYLTVENDSSSNYLFSRTLTRVTAYSHFFIKFTSLVIVCSFGITTAEVYFIFLAICLTIEAMYLSTVKNYYDKHQLMKVFNMSKQEIVVTVKQLIVKCLLLEEGVCLLVLVKYDFSVRYLGFVVLLNIYLYIFINYVLFKKSNIRKE